MRPLRFANLWIGVGWLLVAGLVVTSLAKLPFDLESPRYSDKLAHVLAYLLVMGWFAQIWTARRLLLGHAAFLVALGVALELLQGGTGYRTADVFDAMANAVGVLLGALSARTRAASLLAGLEAQLRWPR
jgi:VanZ family protein